MTANTSAPKPIALSSAPSTSAPGRPFAPFVSGTVSRPAMKTAAPSGMFTRKIQCHEAHWVRAPPANGPMAAAPEITAPHTPNAAPRYLPRNTAFTVESVDGMIRAAPIACTARAAMSGPAASAIAARMLPPTKTTRPTWNRSFRPHLSASLPVDSKSAASRTAYRLLTHCASVRSSPISAMITGRATPTIVPSRTIIPSPVDSTARASHSRRVGGVTRRSVLVLTIRA